MPSARIARAVDAERHCCRFLRFTLTVEPDEGLVTLDLTGLTGTRELTAALLGVFASWLCARLESR